MANGIRTLSGSVNGTMTYFTNNFPTLTALSGTAVWNTTYILIGISNLSFTIPTYNVSNGTQEIRILLSTATNFTSLNINTSNFTDIYGFSDLELEPDKAYEISIMPLNDNIVTLICKDIGEYFSPLPSGYTRLEYIQSSGTQYINTGAVIDVDNIEVKMTAMPLSNNGTYNVPFGAENSSVSYFDLYWATSANPKYYNMNIDSSPLNKYMTSGVVNFNNIQTFDISASNLQATMKIDGNTLSWTYSKTIVNNLAIYIFATNDRGNMGSPSIMKLYESKIYKNGNLIRAFIPAIRNSDSAVGLYDLVNSAFYANSGSGKFYGEGLSSDALIPTMTSNTEPYGTASTSSSKSGYAGNAYMAFDNNVTSAGDVWYGSAFANGTYTIYTFPSQVSNIHIIRLDAFIDGNGTITTGTIDYSTDGSNWTTAINLTSSNFTNDPSGTGISNLYYVNLSNVKAIRAGSTASSNSRGMIVRELQAYR